MSRFVLSTTEGSDKHIPIKPKKLLFEIKSDPTELSTSLSDSKLGDRDVTFRVGCSTFHGHKSVFQSLSSELKRCFEFSGQGFTERTPLQSGGVLKIAQNGASGLTVTVDSNEEVFNLFMDYCYNLGISVPMKTLPSLYLLAKRLNVPSLYAPCADYLSRHVNLDIIGELSRLVEFSALANVACTDACETTNKSTTASELQLASAVHQFLLQKADLVASSLTAQLSTRLLVRLTLDPDDLTGDLNYSPTTCCDGRSAFSVLRWCHERVVLGERLARSGSEENVLSDDEDEDGGACTVPCSSTTNSDDLSELGRPDPFGRRRSLSRGRRPRFVNHRPADGQQTRLDFESRSSTDDEEENVVTLWEKRKSERRRSTKDVRIALEMSELNGLAKNEANSCVPEDFHQRNGGVGDHRSTFRILAHRPKDGGAETETCLLAPTSLGAGTTSIWLGKLTGRLVSLSVKTCRPASSSSSASPLPQSCSSSQTSLLVNGSRLLSSSSVGDLTTSGNGELANLNGRGEVGTNGGGSSLDDEAGFTVTPASASQLAKAAATVLTLNGSCRMDSPGRTATPPSTTRLLEARSGAGAGLLALGESLVVAVVGGFTRSGCLDTVELLGLGTADGEAGELAPPVPGPLLSRLRGRLALATTNEPGGDGGCGGVVYACGGSNGSVDLASVERLTSQSLSEWLSKSSSSTTTNNTSTSSSQDKSQASAWQSVRRLQQARSCPCAVGLFSSPSAPGSVLVAGGVAGSTALASVECFVPARNEWIRLPDMLEARVEATCAALPSRQLVLVAAGSTVAAAAARGWLPGSPFLLPSVCVEALDLRTPAWSVLPGPALGSSAVLRGACLLPAPAGRDELLLIGGFNGSAALDTVWCFDSAAWRWRPYTSLSVARSSACGVTCSDRSFALVVGGFNMAASSSGFLDSLELLLPA